MILVMFFLSNCNVFIISPKKREILSTKKTEKKSSAGLKCPKEKKIVRFAFLRLQRVVGFGGLPGAADRAAMAEVNEKVPAEKGHLAFSKRREELDVVDFVLFEKGKRNYLHQKRFF